MNDRINNKEDNTWQKFENKDFIYYNYLINGRASCNLFVFQQQNILAQRELNSIEHKLFKYVSINILCIYFLFLEYHANKIGSIFSNTTYWSCAIMSRRLFSNH